MTQVRACAAAFILLFAGLLCLLQAQAQMGPLTGANTPFTKTSRGGGNAVTFDAASSPFGRNGGNDNSVITDLTITGGLINPGLIVVFVNTGGVSVTAPAAVWDFGGSAQSMTVLINQDAGTGRQVIIFGLRNPISGNKTLLVSWTGTTIDLATAALSFSHVNSASDAAAFPNFTGASTGGTPDSITITTGANNYAVAGYSSLSNFSSVSDSQLFLDNAGSVWAAAANYKVSTGATDTLTGSPGNAVSAIAGGAIAHD